MLKLKDGLGKLVGTTYEGSADYLLRANGDTAKIADLSVAYATKAATSTDADKCDGLHVHSGRNSEANKIVRTDSNGYIQCGYINSSIAASPLNSNPGVLWGSNGGGDNYLRAYNLAYVKVGSATKAAQDSDGSQINTTYLKKAGGTMSGTIKFGYGTPALDFRPSTSSYGSKVEYMTYGNEALVFANSNAITSFIFKCGKYLPDTTSNNWHTEVPVPTMQMKGQSLYINKLIAHGVTPPYNLYVEGTSYLNGSTTVNSTLTANNTIHSNGGYLKSTHSSRYIQIGSQGSEYIHYSTDANNGHWFNTTVKVKGDLYAGTNYDKKVWHAGNFNPSEKANTSGTYSGLNVGYATKATQDGSGNNIVNTYYKKSGGQINKNGYIETATITTGDSTFAGGLRLREKEYLGTSIYTTINAYEAEGPGISFIWGGKRSHKLSMDYDGDLRWPKSIRVSEQLQADGNMLCYNLIATSDVYAHSDIRLKSNIKPLTNRGIIEPKTFIKQGKASIGFIAQDMQKLYPELVIADNSENHYLAIDYAQYTAVLQAQIIDLQKQINELKKKVYGNNN